MVREKGVSKGYDKFVSCIVPIMTIVVILSFVLLSITLLSHDSRAGFSVRTSCDSVGYCLEGREVVVNVTITNEGLNPLIIKKVFLFDELEHKVGVVSGANIESGESRVFQLSINGLRLISNERLTSNEENNKGIVRDLNFSFVPCFLIGVNETITNESLIKKLNRTWMIRDDLRCYESFSVKVMPNPIRHCDSDVDCEENRFCYSNLCFNLSCYGCSHAENHSCVPYECCENNDCSYDEYCFNHSCVFLNCEDNETFVDHSCVELNCGFFREARIHECVVKESVITTIKVLVGLFLLLTLLSLFFGKKRKKIKALIKSYITSQRVKYHKRKEKEHLELAKVHYKLLKYLKNKEELEKHKRIIAYHEKRADFHRRKWVAYLKGFVVCPVCDHLVPEGYEFCPYCGAKL